MQTLVACSATHQALELPDRALRGFTIGAGPPLVILHGYAPGTDSRSEFPHQVADLAGRFQLLMLDLPGFGVSADVPIVKNYLSDAVDRLIASLDALGLETVPVLATSLGGWAAARAALEYPERVGRLVLVNPSILDPGAAGQRPSEGERRLASFLARPSSSAMLAWLETQVGDPGTITDGELDAELERAMTPGAIARLKAVFCTLGGREQASAVWMHSWKIDQPAMVIWGRENRDFLIDGGLYGALRMPNADVHALAGAGGRVHRERPAAVTRMVTDFLTI